MKRMVWNREIDERLKTLWSQNKTLEYMADELGIQGELIEARLKKLGKSIAPRRKKNWTQEEDETLRELWGWQSLQAIANTLGRTETAIKLRVQKLKLGPAIDRHEFVKISDFVEYSGMRYYAILGVISTRLGFPLEYKLTGTRRHYFVDLDKALKWMESHQEYFDASKVSPYLFPDEPQWMKDKRMVDRVTKRNLNSSLVRKTWSKEDDAKLKDMVLYGKDYNEIADYFQITKGQVDRRVQHLNLSYMSPSLFWRSKDFKYLNEHWETQTDEEIAKAIGKSVISVTKHRNQLGLLRVGKKKRYSQDEIKYIENNLDKTDKEIADALGRTEASVGAARLLNNLIKESKAIEWTPSEIDFIQLNYAKMTDAEIGKALNKDPRGVQTLRQKYGWIKRKKRKEWTKDEEDYLISNLNKPDKEIANVLERTEIAVREHRHELGYFKERPKKDKNNSKTNKGKKVKKSKKTMNDRGYKVVERRTDSNIDNNNK